MRIATKLLAISLVSVVLVSGVVTALVMDEQQVATGYQAILQGPVVEAAQVRQAQLDFKMQLQDWDNMLLRGEDPVELAACTLQFETQEAKVKAEVGALAMNVDDAEARTLLTRFLIADDALSEKYQAAYWIYVKQGYDFRAADALMHGLSQKPATLLDRATTALEGRATMRDGEVREQSVQQWTLLFSVAGMLLAVDCLLYCGMLMGVKRRLKQLKAVSDRLAVADMEGLSIDVAGEDEIGAIGNSLRGVEAELQELLLVHAR